MPKPLLPKPFKDIDQLVASGWALPTERERNRKRYASTMLELQDVYDTLLPRADAALTYLSGIPLDDMPVEAKRLHYLMLSLAEISCAVERHHQPTVPNGFDTERFTPYAPHGEIP
jgi:hypothetical protein